jgi:hypothetical protein
MLSRQRESGWGRVPDTNALEDMPVFMEAFECFVKAVESRVGEYTHPCSVTEVEVGSEAASDVLWDETFNRRHPDLK